MPSIDGASFRTVTVTRYMPQPRKTLFRGPRTLFGKFLYSLSYWAMNDGHRPHREPIGTFGATCFPQVLQANCRSNVGGSLRQQSFSEFPTLQAREDVDILPSRERNEREFASAARARPKNTIAEPALVVQLHDAFLLPQTRDCGFCDWIGFSHA